MRWSRRLRSRRDELCCDPRSLHSKNNKLLPALAILTRCAEAALPRGRIVIVNAVSADEDGPASPALLMMVLVGGKNRTLAEFRSLSRGKKNTGSHRVAPIRSLPKVSPKNLGKGEH